MGKPIEMPFLGLTQADPRNNAFDGVKIRRIHSQLRGVTSRRCGLSSKFFDHLFLLLLMTENILMYLI